MLVYQATSLQFVPHRGRHPVSSQPHFDILFHHPVNRGTAHCIIRIRGWIVSWLIRRNTDKRLGRIRAKLATDIVYGKDSLGNYTYDVSDVLAYPRYGYDEEGVRGLLDNMLRTANILVARDAGSFHGTMLPRAGLWIPEGLEVGEGPYG